MSFTRLSSNLKHAVFTPLLLSSRPVVARRSLHQNKGFLHLSRHKALSSRTSSYFMPFSLVYSLVVAQCGVSCSAVGRKAGQRTGCWKAEYAERDAKWRLTLIVALKAASPLPPPGEPLYPLSRLPSHLASATSSSSSTYLIAPSLSLDRYALTCISVKCRSFSR